MRLDQICFNKQQLTINENKKKMSAKTSFKPHLGEIRELEGFVCVCRVIDGVAYGGKVKEKKKANRQYNRAKKEGSSAAKIESQ